MTRDRRRDLDFEERPWRCKTCGARIADRVMEARPWAKQSDGSYSHERIAFGPDNDPYPELCGPVWRDRRTSSTPAMRKETIWPASSPRSTD